MTYNGEGLCMMCGEKNQTPGSAFCVDCDRLPPVPLTDVGSVIKDESSIAVCDTTGNVLYAADLPAGTDVHAAARDMFKALKEKGYPLIQLTFLKVKSEV